MEQFIIQMLRHEFHQSCANFCNYSRTPEEVSEFATATINHLWQHATQLGFTPIKSQEELVAARIEAINKQLH